MLTIRRHWPLIVMVLLAQGCASQPITINERSALRENIGKCVAITGEVWEMKGDYLIECGGERIEIEPRVSDRQVGPATLIGTLEYVIVPEQETQDAVNGIVRTGDGFVLRITGQVGRRVPISHYKLIVD